RSRARRVRATLCALRYSQGRPLSWRRNPGRARQTARKMSWNRSSRSAGLSAYVAHNRRIGAAYAAIRSANCPLSSSSAVTEQVVCRDGRFLTSVSSERARDCAWAQLEGSQMVMFMGMSLAGFLLLGALTQPAPAATTHCELHRKDQTWQGTCPGLLGGTPA